MPNPYNRLPPAPAPPRMLAPPRMRTQIIPAPPMVPPAYPGDTHNDPRFPVGGPKIITESALDDKGVIMEPELERHPTAPIGNRNGARPYFGRHVMTQSARVMSDFGEITRPPPPPAFKESLRGVKEQDVEMIQSPGGWPGGAYRAPAMPGKRMPAQQVVPCHCCSDGAVDISEDSDYAVCPNCGGAVCPRCVRSYHRARRDGRLGKFPCPVQH